MIRKIRPHFTISEVARMAGVNRRELLDLERDPHEYRNVYADPEYASVVTELSDELRRLREELRVSEE